HGRPGPGGRRAAPAGGVHAEAGGDAVRQQPLDPAQPHGLRGLRRAGTAAALCAAVAATVGRRERLRRMRQASPHPMVPSPRTAAGSGTGVKFSTRFDPLVTRLTLAGLTLNPWNVAA